MPTPVNIALFGFMATGKSTVGRLVAKALAWEFVDLDTLIEAQAGCPITEIFAQEGETGFRRREHEQVLHVAETLSHTVIATGGGVVLDPRNVVALGKRALLVCLTLSPEATFERIRNDTTRPLLLDHADPLQRIRDLQAERAPFYEAIPHQIARDNLTPEQTANAILTLYQSCSVGCPQPIPVSPDKCSVGCPQPIPVSPDKCSALWPQPSSTGPAL